MRIKNWKQQKNAFLDTVDKIFAKKDRKQNEFKLKKFLAIRSDCIFGQGELPAKLNLELYHLEKYNSVGLQGKENVYVFATRELLARRLLRASKEKKKTKKMFWSREIKNWITTEPKK